VILAEFFESVLPPELAWLKPFLPYLKPLVIESVADFCAVDPPGNPSLIGLTFFALLADGQIGAGLVAAEAVAQFIANYLWYNLCECASVTTPARPVGPSAPTDLPIVNPPTIVTPPTASPCGQSTTTGATAVPGTTPTGLFVQNLVSQFEVPPFNGTSPPMPYLNAVSGIAHVTNVPQTGTHASMSVVVQTRPVGGSAVVQATVTVGSGVTAHIPFLIPIGHTSMEVVGTNVSSVTGNSGTVQMDIYCTGQTPGGVLFACCPPDPQLTGLLAQIRATVNLLQRQAAPFGYVYGDNHPGITDNGSISVTGLLGVAVDVTTLPTSYGQRDGSPPELFDVGFVTLGTADGFTSSRRIDHDGTLVLPTAAGVYTSIGYTLSPGVVVAIRELVREPS